MAAIRILKIHTTGVGIEHSPSADGLVMTDFTVTGSGPSLSGTGLDLTTQNISNAGNLSFDDPTTAVINATAGNLIIDDIMAKDRDNVMAAGSAILFGSVGDVAAALDAFQLPQASALPTATPANNSNNGFMVSYNGKPYHWNGSSWDDLTTAESTGSITNIFTADEAIDAREVVYISAADNVSLADSDVDASSVVIGFATETVADTDPVTVQSAGILAGFTGLTPGAVYYLDGTAGAITATLPPGNSGKNIVKVGVAKSATELFIDIQYLSKRGT